MSAREKFEERCRQLGRTFEWHPLMKFYSPSEIDGLWDEWQASRTAALEEAARICDDEVYADRAGRRIRVLAKGEGE